MSKSHPNLKIIDRGEGDSVIGFNVQDSLNDQMGPLSAFTEESIDIMKIASKEIDDSKDLRVRSLILMRDSIEFAKKNSRFVDEQFTRKISEQLNLTVG